MKKPYRLILDLSLIVFYLFLFFWPLGLFNGPVGDFSGFPKGDDAQVHSGLVLFYSREWPHINWYPYWYTGFPISLSYHPLVNYAWALFVIVTNFTAEFTLFLFSALSFTVIAVVLYLLVYKITQNHNAALLTPVLTITSVGFIGTLAVGGAYTRVFATMLWIVSLYFLIDYIKTDGDKRYFIGIVVLLASTLLSNMLVGIFAILTTFVTLFLCTSGWKKRAFHLLRVFITTLALSAFFYVPFFFSYLSKFVDFGLRGEHYSAPMPLLDFGASSILPLVFLLVSTLLVRFSKVRFEGSTLSLLKALKVLILFFFIYGFLDWPSSVRFFATYDTTYFLPIYLSIYDCILLGVMFNRSDWTSALSFRRPGSTNIMQRNRNVLPTIMLISVLILPFLYRPLLTSYIVDPGADSNQNPAYVAQLLLKIDQSDTGFRFSSDWIQVIRWFNYYYPNISQTSGTHAISIMYPDWFPWFDEAVFTSEGNWNETNFLLDWYAVKYLLIGETVTYAGGGAFTRNGLVDKYLDRPEYYENVSMAIIPQGTWSGSVYQFNYKYAKPILSATNSTTLLVVGKVQLYDNLFRSLAYSDFNEHYMIPIRAQGHIDDYSLEQLMEYDSVLVDLDGDYYTDYEKTWRLIGQYVSGGGGLLLEGGSESLIPNPSPINSTRKVDTLEAEWNFSAVSHRITEHIDFSSFSSPGPFIFSAEGIRSGAEAILWNNDTVVIASGRYGKGRVVWNGLGLSHRASYNGNFMESYILSKMLNWISNNDEDLAFEAFPVSQPQMTFSRPNPESVEIYVETPARGILFKESFLDSWQAFLIGNDGNNENLDIHRAGPDFMYISLPEEAVYPVKIVVDYRRTSIELISEAVSIVTLVGLLLYVTWTPFIERLEYTLKKARAKESKSQLRARLRSNLKECEKGAEP